MPSTIENDPIYKTDELIARDIDDHVPQRGVAFS